MFRLPVCCPGMTVNCFLHRRLQRPWLSLWESCQPNRLTERVLRLMVGSVIGTWDPLSLPRRGSQLSHRESQGRFAPYRVRRGTIHRNTQLMNLAGGYYPPLQGLGSCVCSAGTIPDGARSPVCPPAAESLRNLNVPPASFNTLFMPFPVSYRQKLTEGTRYVGFFSQI